jgi:hypothetical protein
LLNKVIFTKIYVDNSDHHPTVTGDDLAPVRAVDRRQANVPNGASETLMVNSRHAVSVAFERRWTLHDLGVAVFPLRPAADWVL